MSAPWGIPGEAAKTKYLKTGKNEESIKFMHTHKKNRRKEEQGEWRERNGEKRKRGEKNKLEGLKIQEREIELSYFRHSFFYNLT